MSGELQTRLSSTSNRLSIMGLLGSGCHANRVPWAYRPSHPELHHVIRERRTGSRHLTRWVLRTARLRAPATQPMKGIGRERRGTSCAALAVGSGGS